MFNHIAKKLTLVLLSSACLIAPHSLAGNKPPATTAHSIVNPNYERTRLPSGEWEAETYTFGKGEMLDPTDADSSLTKLSFTEIAQILAVPLAEEGYLPTSSAAETDILIVVSWGKTVPSNDALKGLSLDGISDALSNAQRLQTNIAIRDSSITEQQIIDGDATLGPTDAEESILAFAAEELTTMMMMQELSDRTRRQANDKNARILGYAPALSDAYKDALPVGLSKSRLEDLISEIETPRYFVILQAYDFKKLWKEKEKELLWMTRFSIRARGRNFDEELSDMTAAAARLFGQESDTLKRHLRPGKAKLGEVEVVEYEEAE